MIRIAIIDTPRNHIYKKFGIDITEKVNLPDKIHAYYIPHRLECLINRIDKDEKAFEKVLFG